MRLFSSRDLEDFPCVVLRLILIKFSLKKFVRTKDSKIALK